jgi:uncharacterized protein (TIRG00374 family)
VSLGSCELRPAFRQREFELSVYHEELSEPVTSRLKMAVSLALGALFVYLFTNKLDWVLVWSDVRKAVWWQLGLAAVLLSGTYLARSLRWRILLAPMARPSLGSLMRATVVGFSALFLMGRAGEMIVRPAVLSVRERISPSVSYATVLIDRVFDMVTVVLLFAVNLAFFEYRGRDSESLHALSLIRIAGILLLLAAGAGIYGLSVFRKRREPALGFLERKLVRLPRPIFLGLMNLLRHLSDGLAVLHDAKSLVASVLYTGLLWSLVIGVYVLVIRAFGISSEEVPITGAVFVLGLSMMGSLVPTPGGGTGPFHAASAAALALLGVERNKAASTAIVLHLIIYLPAVIIGLCYAARDGLSFFGQLRVNRHNSRPGSAFDADHLENNRSELDLQTIDFQKQRGKVTLMADEKQL